MTLDSLTQNMDVVVRHTQQNLPLLGEIVLLLGGIWFANLFVGGRLCLLGIHPRRWFGLPGIFFAPLLHADFNHLFFNLMPLVVLGDFILIQGVHYFYLVTALLILMSGLLIWCFARSGIYVGASAVITGYWAILVTNIFTMGGVLAIALGGVSLYYFAAIFFGIFPSARDVSWEGHLFGLVSGFLISWFII